MNPRAALRLARSLLVLTASVAAAAFSQAQDRFVGRYEAVGVGQRSDLRLTLSLEERGRCELTIDGMRGRPSRSVRSGTWRSRTSSRIETEFVDGRDRDRIVFRREGNGDLVSSEWDREAWGSNPIEFRLVKGGSSPGDYALLGTYEGSADRYELTLILAVGGSATLQSETRDRTPRVETLRGTWWTDSLRRLRVVVSRDRIESVFIFRVSANRITAVDWDRGRWGRTAPDLQKSRTGGVSDRTPEGRWLSRRTQNAKLYVYSMTLSRGGKATFTVSTGSVGSTPRTFQGSWFDEGTDRVRIECSLGRERADFTFRADRNALTAIRWDSRVWGSAPLVFRRD